VELETRYLALRRRIRIVFLAALLVGFACLLLWVYGGRWMRIETRRSVDYQLASDGTTTHILDIDGVRPSGVRPAGILTVDNDNRPAPTWMNSAEALGLHWPLRGVSWCAYSAIEASADNSLRGVAASRGTAGIRWSGAGPEPDWLAHLQTVRVARTLSVSWRATSGLVVAMLAVGGLVVAFVADARIQLINRSLARLRAGECRACAYPLPRDNPDQDRCPECGLGVDEPFPRWVGGDSPE
jgi:hypothetical protein